MTASSGVPELAELILTAAGYEMNGMSANGIMGKQGIIQVSKPTKSSLAANLASDRIRRVTWVIEYRPVFGPPFDA
jgi:hypothetical protein